MLKSTFFSALIKMTHNSRKFLLLTCCVLLLVSCGGGESKPIAKSEVYPAALIGTWEWGCLTNHDTEGTEKPLFDRGKVTFGGGDAYRLEITTFNTSSCVEGSEFSKAIYKGTFTAESVVDRNQTPYVELDIIVTSRTFEGSSLIGATAVSGALHSSVFNCKRIAKILLVSNQLQINWESGLVDSGFLDSSGNSVAGIDICPYGHYDEFLSSSSITQPTYIPIFEYNTTAISELEGKWTEGCYKKGTDTNIITNTDTIYYADTTYEIAAMAGNPSLYSYTQINALYTDINCNGAPVSFYKLPGTIIIDTGFGGDGIGPSNLPGISGLHVIISFGPTQSTLSDTGSVSLSDPTQSSQVYEIMVGNNSSDFLFVNGKHVHSPTDILRDVYVRVTSASGG